MGQPVWMGIEIRCKSEGTVWLAESPFCFHFQFLGKLISKKLVSF